MQLCGAAQPLRAVAPPRSLAATPCVAGCSWSASLTGRELVAIRRQRLAGCVAQQPRAAHERVRPCAAPSRRLPRRPRLPAAPRASAQEDERRREAEPEPSRAALTFAGIKRFGVAGTLSYVLTEVAFWAVALPGAAFGYHATTGEWLSWQTDRAQLAALAATFVTGVRFAVPLRMGVALACVPAVQRALDAAGVARDAQQPAAPDSKETQ